MDIDGAPLCRVCRSDDPSLGPLFHPCRCTGSIAHVHQDCLSTWLSHSKKSSCELCGHLFSFEKVYKPGSPDRPPFTAITSQALKEIALFLILLSRAVLVGLCWLAIVPWTVVWVSSAYWKVADWFAFGLTSNIDQLSSSSNSSKPSASILNSSAAATHPKTSTASTSPTNTTLSSSWITNLTPSLELDPNSIALDIFQGQLITCAIILSFVVIFLLREWILQNTPPPDLIRLAEDEELPQQPLLNHPALDHLRPPASEPVEQPVETSTDRDDRRQDESPESSKTNESSQSNHSVDLTPLPPSQAAFPNSQSLASENFWTKADQKSCFTFQQEQQLPTPGLLELADPGLGMPFYKPHDPIDSDIFSHRILVTSTYLLFIAVPSDTPFLATPSKSPHFGDPNDSQKKLIEAWTNLAATTILHPSNQIPNQILQLRTYISCSLAQDDSSLNEMNLQEIEFNWTRALLSDPKICKHLQYLFNPRCYSTQTVHSQDQIQINGLIYSLLSIYNAIESLSVIHESSSSEEEENLESTAYDGYQRIYDLMRLFVLPLLDVPHPELRSVRLNQLEADIHEMIRKHDPVFLSNRSPDKPSIGSLKYSLVAILVKQKVLATLIDSSTFLRYSRGMASDDNLFTNWRLKSTRPFSQSFLNPQRVINPENDLCEITIQLINFKATVELRLKSNKTDDQSLVDWIDHSTFDHKLLVTSSYLLLSAETADISYPALQTPALANTPENPSQDQPNEILSLQAWLKLAKSCTTKPSELLLRFKNFSLHSSVVSFEDRIHSFQRLETEWLSKLLSDPLIAQFLVLILTQNHNENERATASLGDHTPHFFLLKLLYVYTVLETLIPRSESQQAVIIYENASKILDEHLKRLQAEPPDRVHEVLEIIRQTRFLLDSCQPAKSFSDSVTVPNNNTELRSELLITRMKRGIIAILACQNIFGKIVTDRRFAQYARAMLFKPNLFSRVSTLLILEQLEEEDLNLLDYERVDKGKDKVPDQAVEEPSEKVAINEYDSLVKTKQTEELSPLDQSLDISHHIDTFNWVEDTRQSSTQATSHHPDKKDLFSGNSDGINSPLADVAHLSSTPPVSPLESNLSAEEGPSSNLPKIGTPAPGRRPTIDHPPEPQTENVERVVNPDVINPGQLQVAERAVAGRLPGFGPQGAQREAAPGPGLADGFVFDNAGAANVADEELMAEDIDGILELIGMKGSLLMLAQNVGLMTLLLSLSLLAFVHLPHMIGKITVLSKGHRLMVPPFKGLLILKRCVHRLLDCLSDYVKLHLLQKNINHLQGYRNFGHSLAHQKNLFQGPPNASINSQSQNTPFS